MNVKLSEPIEKSKSIVDKVQCPKCNQQTCLSSGFPDIPLKFKVLFFSVTLGLNISVQYCPNCGFLSIKLA